MPKFNEDVQLAEFGDFQTPRSLSAEICQFLVQRGIRPAAIVEPTCGEGSFVESALAAFAPAVGIWAFDCNAAHLYRLQAKLGSESRSRVMCWEQNFFSFDWPEFVRTLPDDVLFLGNPPWVTNAAMGALGNLNLPVKSNFQKRSGLAAKTGAANFDISEWMLIRLAEALGGKRGMIAMLCKTSTARRFLRYAWTSDLIVSDASLHHIDADEHFGVTVEACLLLCRLNYSEKNFAAAVYETLGAGRPRRRFGLAGKEMVSNLDDYRELRDLDGSAPYRWRSGHKHDCSKVMEFEKSSEGYVNGAGECIALEEDCIYPLLKSSDVGNGRTRHRKYVLLPQTKVGEDTASLQVRAPLTWRYLETHGAELDKRGSSIYRNRPRFSVFGIGEYSFAKWKVCVSGLYKSLRFCVVGPANGRPVMLDDTCYFIGCKTRREAEFVTELLNSELARRFLGSLAFFDAKRPVTVDVLRRIDLPALARRIGREAEAAAFWQMEPEPVAAPKLRSALN
jgi:hypothetical protein